MIAKFMMGLVLAGAGSVAVMAASEGPPGDAVKGGHEFVALGCSACHGTTGAGGGWQGPKLAPTPIAFAAFLGQLREPAEKMPRYSPAVLSDAEVANLYAYLRDVKPNRRGTDIGMLAR